MEVLIFENSSCRGFFLGEFTCYLDFLLTFGSINLLYSSIWNSDECICSTCYYVFYLIMNFSDSLFCSYGIGVCWGLFNYFCYYFLVVKSFFDFIGWTFVFLNFFWLFISGYCLSPYFSFWLYIFSYFHQFLLPNLVLLVSVSLFSTGFTFLTKSYSFILL